MNSVRGVIFDIDGTLVNSNDAHAESWVAGLAEFGFKVEFDRVRHLIGKGGDKILPELTGIEKESDEGKRITARRLEIFKEQYLPSLKPFPGARALASYLHGRGIRLVVASSANKDELGELLQIAGVEEYMEHTTSSSDAENSKPDPDIIEAALQSLGLLPSQVMMIGDTPYDIEAAEKAGIRTIAFRCGGFPEDSLRGAVALYDGPADLLARCDASPLAGAPRHDHAIAEAR
jgi:HAD superfamily hydrolase (TIGR01549 family)